jgi:hypothetical protein
MGPIRRKKSTMPREEVVSETTKRAMTVRDAAIDLEREFNGADWFSGIGVGRSGGKRVVYVYVNHRGADFELAMADYQKNGYEGFIVKSQMTGGRP